MSTAPETDVDPVDRIRDAERILRALRQAAYEALLDHKRTGDAVAIWQGGRVVRIPEEQIPVPTHADTEG